MRKTRGEICKKARKKAKKCIFARIWEKILYEHKGKCYNCEEDECRKAVKPAKTK